MAYIRDIKTTYITYSHRCTFTHSTEQHWPDILVPTLLVAPFVTLAVLYFCRLLEWCCFGECCRRCGCMQYRLCNGNLDREANWCYSCKKTKEAKRPPAWKRAHKVGDEVVVVADPGNAHDGKKGIVVDYSWGTGDEKPYRVRFADNFTKWFGPENLKRYIPDVDIAESEGPRVDPAVESTDQPAATAVHVTTHHGDETARDDANKNGAVEMTYPDDAFGKPHPTTTPPNPDAVSVPSSSVDVPAERAPRDDTNYGENETATPIAVAEPEPTDVVSSAECVVVPLAAAESDSRVAKFCGNCGTQRYGSSKFCVSCGNDLSLHN